MLSLSSSSLAACCCSSSCSLSTSKVLSSPSSILSFLRRNPRKSITRSSAASTEESISAENSSGNYSGVQLQEIVQAERSIGDGLWKSRIDSWISSRIHGVSRARVQSSIRAGLVTVNGRIIDKVSHVIRAGDKVNCTISELQPLRAEPEDIPIDIVYEDAHVLVVNKPAHMVVHPAPGNANGTLVNGILHHCTLPTITLQSNNILSESEDDSDAEDSGSLDDQTSCMEISPNMIGSSVRPGIVHRLDKGTSGLLVVAKDEHSHAHLSEQFKQHSIHRVYVSLTSGVPSTLSGRVEVPIGRDTNNRVRMAAMPGPNISRQVRHAASRYKVIEVLAGGGSALVEWRLETGRTHQINVQLEHVQALWLSSEKHGQTLLVYNIDRNEYNMIVYHFKIFLVYNKIRAHAKYLGIPLLGDEVYGGTKSLALSLLQHTVASSHRGDLAQLVSKFERPCLHALALGFKHPHTGDKMQFSCQPPADFAEILTLLRRMGCTKPSLEK